MESGNSEPVELNSEDRGNPDLYHRRCGKHPPVHEDVSIPVAIFAIEETRNKQPRRCKEHEEAQKNSSRTLAVFAPAGSSGIPSLFLFFRNIGNAVFSEKEPWSLSREPDAETILVVVADMPAQSLT